MTKQAGIILLKKKASKAKTSSARVVPSNRERTTFFDALLFDIDNVLINTRKSYLDTIRWTVDIFLTDGNVPFFLPTKGRASSHILSSEDVDQFKLLGGFNDDWDCCYGLLVYLITLPAKKRTVEDLRKMIKIKELLKKVQKRPLQVSGLVKMFGRPPGVTIEKISRIFQEVYLGKDLFFQVYGKRAVYWNRQGLLHKEKIIFKKAILEKLKARNLKMGIATGRPRSEALYSLKHFGIAEYFTAMTSIDEIKKAENEAKQSLRKPHPYSLIETAKKLGAKQRFLYIGDLPDDVLATGKAKSQINIQSVAFPTFSAQGKSGMEAIKKARPNYIIGKPNDLLQLVRNPARFSA